MTKNIGWDEKLRVSALRAACASEFETEFEFVRVHEHSDGQVGIDPGCSSGDIENEKVTWTPEKDERRVERILGRAEVFERWLTRGGWETISQIVSKTRTDVETRPVQDNPQA